MVALFAAALLSSRGADAVTPGAAPNPHPAAGDEAVTRILEPIREKYNLPAMAGAVVTSDRVTYVGVVGVRKRGTTVAAGLDDQWHLGSDGKAMTSALIARLVERGQLKWDSTLGEIFPDIAPKMNPAFRGVTVLQLLSHRAGLPANLGSKLGYLFGDDRLLRVSAVRTELARAPVSTPGSKFAYSNLGYVIAGAIVEKVTGKSWEHEITEEIFKPLGMTSAGFGGTGTVGKIDQPWPHARDGTPMPSNGPAEDNPPVMGPAGRIHCTIRDWALFVRDQLRGARGEPALLKPESYKTIQTSHFGDDYGLGWFVVQRDWAGGTAFNHAGDNTMNFANVWVAPKKDFALLVCVNQTDAFNATDEAVGGLLELANK